MQKVASYCFSTHLSWPPPRRLLLLRFYRFQPQKKKKGRKGETSVQAREKEGKGGKRLTTWVSEWYDGTTRDDKESRALQGAAATSPVHLANFLVN